MKTQNFLFAALIMVLTYGCTTAMQSSMQSFTTNSNGWKPADFKPENGVLLIQRITRPKGQQRKIEDFMAKEYPFKYEFVDIKDIESNNKYADKNIYRFALAYSYSNRVMNGATKPSYYVAFDFNFIDRLNNETYPKSGIESSWASKTFKKIIQNCLEK